MKIFKILLLQLAYFICALLIGIVVEIIYPSHDAWININGNVLIVGIITLILYLPYCIFSIWSINKLKRVVFFYLAIAGLTFLIAIPAISNTVFNEINAINRCQEAKRSVNKNDLVASNYNGAIDFYVNFDDLEVFEIKYSIGKDKIYDGGFRREKLIETNIDDINNSKELLYEFDFEKDRTFTINGVKIENQAIVSVYVFESMYYENTNGNTGREVYLKTVSGKLYMLPTHYIIPMKNGRTVRAEFDIVKIITAVY